MITLNWSEEATLRAIDKANRARVKTSYRNLALYARYTERTVQNCVKSLEQKNLIRVHRQYKPHRYELLQEVSI